VAEFYRKVGISPATYFNWKKTYGAPSASFILVAP
jgi:hypothetical protein